jgi:hypothetical protein
MQTDIFASLSVVTSVEREGIETNKQTNKQTNNVEVCSLDAIHLGVLIQFRLC